jgi:hypothetical protein
MLAVLWIRIRNFLGQVGSESGIIVQDPDPSPDTGMDMTFFDKKICITFRSFS